MAASTAAYLGRLKSIVETIQGYNDSTDDDFIVQEAVKQHFALKSAVELNEYNRAVTKQDNASATAKSAMSALDEYGLMASQTDASRSRLTDVGGPAGTGTPKKLIGKGGIIESDYFEFSLSRGGGLMFDGMRRRTDADNYLTAHENQITQLAQTVKKVGNAKWALGENSTIATDLEARVLAERNHIVNSRNQLTKVDTYAKADGYNPIGNAILRGKEVAILERYDNLIEQYDNALDAMQG